MLKISHQNIIKYIDTHLCINYNAMYRWMCCIEGCRGCGNLCLNNAIEYVGDKGNNKSNCNCGGNC